jgi:hypothetical protein
MWQVFHYNLITFCGSIASAVPIMSCLDPESSDIVTSWLDDFEFHAVVEPLRVLL